MTTKIDRIEGAMLAKNRKEDIRDIKKWKEDD